MSSSNLEILCDNDNVKNLYMNRPNHEADSGIDLFIPEDVTFKPGETKLVNLKIKCRMVSKNGQTQPYYLFSRSSIYKTPLIQANCTGIIDKDYRGNICVALRYIINDDLINIVVIKQLTYLSKVTLLLRERVWFKSVNVLSNLLHLVWLTNSMKQREVKADLVQQDNNFNLIKIFLLKI